MKYTSRPITLVLTLLLIVSAVAVIEFGPLNAAGRTDTPTGAGASAADGTVVANGTTVRPETPAQTPTEPISGSDNRRSTSSISVATQSTLQNSSGDTGVLPRAERIERKSGNFSRAPGIKNPTGFINTGDDGVSINDTIGHKVILVDFWTYSCINCQHTQPHFNTWQKEYEDDGLLIIGVHRPEFGFERDPSNVKEAVREANITYPVVIDNNAATWNAYGNHYWPHWYLIDVDGFIRYDHIGEGAYKQTDHKIQKLLTERNRVLNATDRQRTSGNRTQVEPSQQLVGHSI